MLGSRASLPGPAQRDFGFAAIAVACLEMFFACLISPPQER